MYVLYRLFSKPTLPKKSTFAENEFFGVFSLKKCSRLYSVTDKPRCCAPMEFGWNPFFMFFFRLCSVGPIVIGLVYRAGLPGKLQFVLAGKFVIVYISEGSLLGGISHMIPYRAGAFRLFPAEGRNARKHFRHSMRLPHTTTSSGILCGNGQKAC